MTAVTFSSGMACHTVVGELQNGMKVVFSDFVADDGTASTVPVFIDPLNKIFGYAWGQKENDTGGTAAPITVTTSGAMSFGNSFNIATKTTGTSGLVTVTIISIGV